MTSPASPSTWLARGKRLLATRLGRGLALALGASAVLLAAGIAARQARARVLAMPAFRLGPGDVRLVGLEPPLDSVLGPALGRPGAVWFDVSVFDARAESRIQEAVAGHPMVAAVPHVSIRYPDRVEVRVALREPAAWFEVVRKDGRPGFLLVSSDAVLLDPGDYRAYLGRLRLPLPKVRGVRARPPGLLGRVWEDLQEQVAEGIAAARVAAGLYCDFNGTLLVEAIDVSRFPAVPERRRDGEVRLVLHDGTVVEWGRTDRDLSGVAGEDPYETKRWRLEKALTPAGRRHGGYVDVRFGGREDRAIGGA